MKRLLLNGFICVLIGYFIGRFIFTNKFVFFEKNEDDIYFFLQEGEYYDNSFLENNFNGIKVKDNKADKDKIYVYVGITRDLEVAERLINIYENNNIKISIKKKVVLNEEFKNNVEQFDLLINSSNDKDEIIKIEEVVMANYEEIIKCDDNHF